MKEISKEEMHKYLTIHNEERDCEGFCLECKQLRECYFIEKCCVEHPDQIDAFVAKCEAAGISDQEEAGEDVFGRRARVIAKMLDIESPL